MKSYSNNFMELAGPIIESSEFQKLKNIEHHTGSTFEHSINVAYIAYKIAYRYNLDINSVVRGALLHDFFLYQFDKTFNSMLLINAIKHFINHPNVALENARNIFQLNPKEENIIKGHMFPFGMPKSKEAWTVCYADKYITILEYLSYLKNQIKSPYLGDNS